MRDRLHSWRVDCRSPLRNVRVDHDDALVDRTMEGAQLRRTSEGGFDAI